MLHVEEPKIKELLLCGNFGLEKENLRTDADGYLSQTKHPFADNPNIVKDFSENQTEVNTPVLSSASEAVNCLVEYNSMIQDVLRDLPKREYLWQFSNPPYIRNEEDIPIAQFTKGAVEKQRYREYLYAHTNYADSLYISKDENAVMFVTSPLRTGNWRPLPFARLCVYKEGKQVYEGTKIGTEYKDNEEDQALLFVDFSQL